MIRLLMLAAVVIAVAVIVSSGLREAAAWVLAFVSLLILGDLMRSSLAKLRRRSSASNPRRA